LPLTKFSVNVRIYCKKMPFLQNWYKKNKMGEFSGVFNIETPLFCDNIKSRKQDYKMTEVKANLEECSNYLIQLFYKTGQKYSCSRTKIGKLLSIVAFVYALKDKKIFDETIYKYDGCGTAINELKTYIDRDVYIQFDYSDNQEYICDEFLDAVEIPEKHQKTDSISAEVAETIIKVFRKFGSYSACDLGQCINPIVNYDGVAELDGAINLSKICSLNKNDFEKCQTCEQEYCALIEFLF